MDDASRDRLVSLRRDLHRHPEPAWCEFYTVARIVDELRDLEVDALHLGPDALAGDERMAVPDDATLTRWYERAREAGADPATLERLADGRTGAVAVLERGDGPVIALRVDVDGLLREESTDPEHVPAAEGFRSETDAMHACGHDAHAAIGVGVLEAIADSDFAGTLKVVFQPAEEVAGGGKPIAESGHLDDVDYLLAVHVGLGHPTGEVVAGIEDFLAVSQFAAEFTGAGSHAGGRPERGRNAVQAMATAVQNLYAIPRHGDGPTRVNAGIVEGGSAVNVVPETASIEGEARGATTDLMEFVRDRADRVLENAAGMHDCEVEVVTVGEAPSATNDAALVDLAYETADGVAGVTNRRRSDDLGGSEDATYLMRRVQDRGGKAAYVCVGTDHPGGHHTGTFDVDERSIEIGVDWLADAILAIADARP